MNVEPSVAPVQILSFEQKSSEGWEHALLWSMTMLFVTLPCDSDHNAQQEIFWIVDHDVRVKMAAAFAGVKASLSLIPSSSTLQHKGEPHCVLFQAFWCGA